MIIRFMPYAHGNVFELVNYKSRKFYNIGQSLHLVLHEHGKGFFKNTQMAVHQSIQVGRDPYKDFYGCN